MGTRRATLLATLMLPVLPGAALGAGVRVPPSHGSVFAVYHRLHRAGLRVTLTRAQTFTNLDTPRVTSSRPAAGRLVPRGSVVALTLRIKPVPRAPVWRGRTHRLRLPKLVGTRASSIPPLPGVQLRLHLTRLDVSSGPGLLFNFVISRERPIGGSAVQIRRGHTVPRVDFWARQIPAPAYPCAPAAEGPAAGTQIVAADTEAVVTEDTSGQLFGCLRADGRPFSLNAYRARVALAGRWVALATTSADGKYMTCSEQVSTVDLSTRLSTSVYDDGCQAGEPGLPVAIDDLAVNDAGFAAWRTRSITGEARALHGISCPVAGLCVAVDGQGGAVTATNPLGGRSGWSALGVEPNSALLAISCPAASLCVAVDQQGHALTTADPQDGASAHWSSAPTGLSDLQSVTCSSAHLCLVASSDGAVATTPDPTAGAWTVTQLGTGPGWLQGASCPTDTRCFVTDGSSVETSGDPQGGAQTWTVESVDPGQRLSALSCPTASECVAGDERGGLLSSTEPTSGNWPRTFTPGPSAPAGSGPAIAGLSCADAGHCAAVDTKGDAFTSSDPAGLTAAWSAKRIDTTQAFGVPAYLSGVSCRAGECVATDSFGQTLATPDAYGAGSWTATLADASSDCAQAPCVAEKLWARDDQGTRVLDAPAPGTGDAISGVLVTGGGLAWTDAGTPRQATLS